MKKGKLIVLDGADSVGKQTQTKKLVQALIALGSLVETADFPQYNNNLLGRLIGQCQKDTTIVFAEVDPYVASLLYAGDRLESRAMIQGWLDAGKHVVLDRYVSANQLHQGGKIIDEGERRVFFDFLNQLEYGLLKLPVPDLVFYLDVPHEISLQLMRKASAGDKKLYSGGEIDLVEQHAVYQVGARESSISMLQDPTWVKIQCYRNGELRSIDDIHVEILKKTIDVLFN